MFFCHTQIRIQIKVIEVEPCRNYLSEIAHNSYIGWQTDVSAAESSRILEVCLIEKLLVNLQIKGFKQGLCVCDVSLRNIVTCFENS